MKKVSYLIMVFFLSSILVGCVGMPIGSMLKLRQLDPLETNPADVSIAVITHKGVKLKDGAATLTLGYTSSDPEHTFISHSFASIVNDAVVPELENLKGSSDDIVVFFLADEAAKSMLKAQNRIRAIRDKDIEGEGSLSVNIEAGCFVTKKPNKLNTSIYVKFNEEQGYILMQSNIDLLALAEKTGRQEHWPECESDSARPQGGLNIGD